MPRAVVMIWLAVGAAAVGILVMVPVIRRWWMDRARADPRRDPVASRVRADRKLALDEVLDRPSDPMTDVARGLEICAVDDLFSWRAGLRRLRPVVERLPDDDEGGALRAEISFQLGEVDLARRIVAGIRADHWRACGVRAALYELDGDVERAESAWVAALLLAAADLRATPARRLEALRRRHGRHPSPQQQLWDRPR